jgi:hypothetical protein
MISSPLCQRFETVAHFGDACAWKNLVGNAVETLETARMTVPVGNI